LDNDNMDRKSRFVTNFLYYSFILLLIAAGLIICKPVIAPLLVAFLISWILSRPVGFLRRKLNGKHKVVLSICSILLVIAVYAVVIAIATLLGLELLSKAREMITKLPEFLSERIFPALEQFANWLEKVFSTTDPSVTEFATESLSSFFNSASEWVSKMSGKFIGAASSFALKTPKFIITVLVTIIITVYLTLDFKKITSFISKQLPDKANQVIESARNFTKGTITGFGKAYSVIIFMTFCELLIGMLILRVKDPVIIAFIIAIVDILPVLGTGTILIPWALIALILRDYKMAIGIFVLYIIVMTVRNTVEPKLVGETTGLHPIVALCSMFIGISLMGFLGMFIVPIIVAIVKHLNDTGIIKILK
jgi:sporulation integral membrane protein YtvI